jgi:hypothetical protein
LAGVIEVCIADDRVFFVGRIIAVIRFGVAPSCFPF